MWCRQCIVFSWKANFPLKLVKEGLGTFCLWGSHLPGSWECVVVFGVLCCYLDHPAVAFEDLIWLFLGHFHLIPSLFIQVLLLLKTSFLAPTFEEFFAYPWPVGPCLICSVSLYSCHGHFTSVPNSLVLTCSQVLMFSFAPAYLGCWTFSLSLLRFCQKKSWS